MKYQIVSERKSKEDYKISTPRDAFNVLSRYTKEKKEFFIVLTLNGNHEVIRTVIVSIGIANKTMVHPREVFRPAILDSAVAVVIAHNHPSGSLDPSIEDKNITSRLSKAGDLLGIPVLDHIIVSSKGFFSFLETKEPSLNN